MAQLSSISGIGKSSLELLEAAGFLDSKGLAKAGADELTKELARANGILKIAKRAPARSSVEKWIAAAREIEGIPEEVPEEQPKMPVNYEANEGVASMLDEAPLAIPLPARLLMENRLGVGDIPPAILLNRYSGDLEVRVEERKGSAVKPAPKQQVRELTTGGVQVAHEAPPSRLEIDVSRVKSIHDLGPKPERTLKSKSGHEEDRVALIRAPLEKTNRGKDPNSRRYVRGVLHTHPGGVKFGAVVTLILLIWLPLAIVSAALLLLSDLAGEPMAWVPKWILAFPVALPLVGIAYLIWGLGGRCRICGQRLFFPKNCLKNKKAHRIPGLGHIIPLCLHLLLFSWFRCTYCGTPVRLKK